MNEDKATKEQLYHYKMTIEKLTIKQREIVAEMCHRNLIRINEELKIYKEKVEKLQEDSELYRALVRLITDDSEEL